MKYNGRGTKGHIAISTPNLERAIWHMRRRGFEFDFSDATYTADGRAKLVYFAKEIGASRCICCWQNDVYYGPWQENRPARGRFSSPAFSIVNC